MHSAGVSEGLILEIPTTSSVQFYIEITTNGELYNETFCSL
jgi:hypothetical protein